MGNWEWGIGNGEWGMGNGEWGIGNCQEEKGTMGKTCCKILTQITLSPVSPHLPHYPLPITHSLFSI
ncbi:hypothetical protein N0Y54_13340 [Nostoc punctiforme UO1]|uniref:hypothetical protein n=1 Tax=Nostoc punctiforme TaxID=272131 RepID=UPI0030A9D38C